jgi:hypothetical protein
VSTAKKENEIDNLSSDGLEGLLDQIFGPQCVEQSGCQERALDGKKRDGPDLLRETVGDSESLVSLATTLPDTRVFRHRRLRDFAHPKQVQILLNQTKMLRARLEFALDQLKLAHMTEASLRLSLAHAQDQLRELSQKDSTENPG